MKKTNLVDMPMYTCGAGATFSRLNPEITTQSRKRRDMPGWEADGRKEGRGLLQCSAVRYHTYQAVKACILARSRAESRGEAA